jgi:hypothetical protein
MRASPDVRGRERNYDGCNNNSYDDLRRQIVRQTVPEAVCFVIALHSHDDLPRGRHRRTVACKQDTANYDAAPNKLGQKGPT